MARRTRKPAVTLPPELYEALDALVGLPDPVRCKASQRSTVKRNVRARLVKLPQASLDGLVEQGLAQVVEPPEGEVTTDTDAWVELTRKGVDSYRENMVRAS